MRFLLRTCQKISCWFGWHSYKLIQVFDKDTRLIGCLTCKKRWAMNDREQSLLEWDYELQTLYRDTLQNEIKPWPPKNISSLKMWVN